VRPWALIQPGIQEEQQSNIHGRVPLPLERGLYNLVPYQRRAQHAGQCGVEVEGGKVPTHDWLLNLQILTSGGLQ